jgi:hypothetical protein
MEILRLITSKKVDAMPNWNLELSKYIRRGEPKPCCGMAARRFDHIHTTDACGTRGNNGHKIIKNAT